MKQSVGLPNAGSSDGFTSTTTTTTSLCVILCFPPLADRPSFLVYFQQWYQKGFLVKPKKGHSNNTQGQWWEPASLPVIIHLFTELMTVAGGQELGASSHVMSPTHAKGLWGQAGDKKCGLYRKGGKKHTHTKQPLTAATPNYPCTAGVLTNQQRHHSIFDKWLKIKGDDATKQEDESKPLKIVFLFTCVNHAGLECSFERFNIFNGLGLMRERVFKPTATVHLQPVGKWL